jgi:hypothetical protein
VVAALLLPSSVWAFETEAEPTSDSDHVVNSVVGRMLGSVLAVVGLGGDGWCSLGSLALALLVSTASAPLVLAVPSMGSTVVVILIVSSVVEEVVVILESRLLVWLMAELVSEVVVLPGLAEGAGIRSPYV